MSANDYRWISPWTKGKWLSGRVGQHVVGFLRGAGQCRHKRGRGAGLPFSQSSLSAISVGALCFRPTSCGELPARLGDRLAAEMTLEEIEQVAVERLELLQR
jgi:hypothetical protein